MLGGGNRCPRQAFRSRPQEAAQGPRAGLRLLGLKKSNYTYAKEQVERSLAYAYRDRKVRKREFRKLWIMRINAGARANGLSYNQFIAGLKAAEIDLDRKVLADLAVADPAKFGEIVEQAKSALAK